MSKFDESARLVKTAGAVFTINLFAAKSNPSRSARAAARNPQVTLLALAVSLPVSFFLENYAKENPDVKDNFEIEEFYGALTAAALTSGVVSLVGRKLLADQTSVSFARAGAYAALAASTELLAAGLTEGFRWLRQKSETVKEDETVIDALREDHPSA